MTGGHDDTEPLASNGLKEMRNAQLARSPRSGKDTMKAPADVAGQPLSSSPRTTALVSEKVAVSVVFVAAMFMSIMDARCRS